MTPDTDTSIRCAARAVKAIVEKPHHDGVGYTTIGSAIVQALGRVGR